GRRRSVVPRLLVLEDRTLPSTFLVTNLHDSGPGSLRQAVLDANAHPGADGIGFARGVHGTIPLTTGQLTITDSVTINGPGQGTLTVSGNNPSRGLGIASGVAANLAGLTLAQGTALQGGGIDNAGTLTLRDSTVANNRAISGLGGGGILNEPAASLTLKGSSLLNNTATAGAGLDVFGGGLLNEGLATVASSRFSGNQALGGQSFSFFGGSDGGAIDNFGGATLTVIDSASGNNQAISAAGPYFGVGGAIETNAGFTLTTPSTANISNSIFLDNLATGGAGASGNGGALDNEGPGAAMTVTHSALLG